MKSEIKNPETATTIARLEAELRLVRDVFVRDGDTDGELRRRETELLAALERARGEADC